MAVQVVEEVDQIGLSRQRERVLAEGQWLMDRDRVEVERLEQPEAEMDIELRGPGLVLEVDGVAGRLGPCGNPGVSRPS